MNSIGWSGTKLALRVIGVIGDSAKLVRGVLLYQRPHVGKPDTLGFAEIGRAHV